MLANLLDVAGVNHVITIDLHASQMQGFFKCPVDNLHAEPLFARWIRHNVPGWQDAVCVSKNAGGTKRCTSLADALKLNFGMVTTDRRRGGNMSSSMIFTKLDRNPTIDNSDNNKAEPDRDNAEASKPAEASQSAQRSDSSPESSGASQETNIRAHRPNHLPASARALAASAHATHRSPLTRAATTPVRASPILEESEYTDERAREVIHGRLVNGHVVSDDYPSPATSAVSSSMMLEQPEEDPMEMSRASSFFAPEPHALGGSHDAAPSSDEEENDAQNTSLEQMITLVGDVRQRTVFIIDDMIDKAGSWIAAAETVVKRGGATKVYCIATHGLFGGDALQELIDCDCIDTIVVTNSFPIPADKLRASRKLVVLDLSSLLSEAIRRNHYGESISALMNTRL